MESTTYVTEVLNLSDQDLSVVFYNLTTTGVTLRNNRWHGRPPTPLLL